MMTDAPSRNMPDKVPIYHNPNPPKRKVSKLSHSTIRHSDMLLSFDSTATQLAYTDICQLNLFALILYRAKNSGYSDFGLAAEVPDVEKFDDVVFVGRKDEREIVKYIQAKYSESDKSGEIRMSDLKSKYLKNNFSILKYFKSYLEIKKRCNDFGSDLFNFKIDDITVVTNKGFATDILEHFHGSAIRTLTEDNFLYTGNEFKSQKYTIKQGKLYDDLSKVFMEEIKVSQADIDKFFNKFHMVVDYPNRLEMERILEAELREIYNIFESSAKLSMLRMELYDWLMKRTPGFHTYQLASELFARIESKTLDYEMYSISKSNLENSSNEYRFQNNQLLERLEEFLGSDRIFVLALQFNTIRLARMRTMKAFEQLKNDVQRSEQFKAYTHQFGHIFINTTQLLNRNFLKNLKQYLRDEEKQSLIVVELDDIQESLYNSIISHLRNLHKKIVLISKNERVNSLSSEVQETLQVQTNFSDLEPNSQEKLLKTEHVIFQDTSVYINMLIGDQNRNLIDAIALDGFIFGRNVKIGIPFPKNAYIEFFYIKRRLHLNISIRTSITKKLERASSTENAFYLRNGRSLDSADVIVISHSREDFENTVENFKSRNLHWLKYVGDKLFWMQSKGSISELASYRELDAIVEDERQQIEEEALIAKREKIVIISSELGTGKSTLFSSLARQMKVIENLCWTIRIDLIDYSSFLSKKTKEQTTPPTSITDNDNRATDLLIELLGSRNPLSILEERLLRASLQRQENNSNSEKRLKVALFIDNFSEIDHSFRNFVLDMIVGLNSTNVFQMFVSTRPTTRSILEVAVGSFAYEIEPFSKANQLEFFEKHSLDNEVLNSLDNHHDFYGTPLCLEIISKIDADRLKALDENCVFDIFEIMQTSRDDFKEVYGRVFQKYFCDSNAIGRNVDLNKIKCDMSSFLTPNNQSRYADYPVVKFLANLVTVKALVQNGADFKPMSVNGYSILQFAACVGDREMLSYILNHVDDINSKTKQNQTLLHIAVSYNNYEAVKILIENNADINLRDGDGYSILDVAILAENLDICSYLLKYVNIDSRITDGNTPLLFAALKNKVKSIKFFIDNGADVKAVNNDGWTILHAAAKNGSRDSSLYILDNYKDIDVRKTDGATPLHVAIANSNIDTINVLIENKADVHLRDENGWNVWHFAERAGNTEICSYLFNYNREINAKNSDGNTPLLEAAMNNKFEIFKFLIENSADVNAVDFRGWTILHYIAKHGNRNTCSYVLDHYKDIDVREKDGATPLHVAIANNNFDTMKVLIEMKADVNLADNKAWTVWHYAARAGNREICSYLLNYNNNINAQNKNGDTPLLVAATENKVECLKFLIEKGGDVKKVNYGGFTVLHKIAQHGSRDICFYVLDHFRDINAKANNGETPLSLAIGNNNLETVKVLIKSHANLNLTNGRCWTVWHWAAHAGDTKMCSYLLNYNREINAKNSDDKTPLLVAASKNNFNSLKFLIENGADVNAVVQKRCTVSYDNPADLIAMRDNGKTPLFFAVSNKNIESVKVLIENGANITSGSCSIWPIAACNQNSKVCLYLLDSVTDLNMRKNHTEKALSYAPEGSEIRNILLERIAKFSSN